MKGRVLLTGISGFLGSHTAIQLLEKGYEVTGTLRSLDRAPAIRAMLARHTQRVASLRFAQAELMDEQVWYDLTRGMEYVQHVASPLPREVPKYEDELIGPAKDGVLYILRAAAANGVRRVVLTSSIGAAMYGRPKGQESGLYDESAWTDVTNQADTTAYFRSKTIAEQAAWDFIEADTSGLELVTILPGLMLGPVLEEDFGTSANVVLKLVDSSMPALPNVGFDVVDVRSVADLLVRAMEQPDAAGERFMGSAGYLALAQVAALLHTRFPGRKIPRWVLPNLLTRVFSWFYPAVRPILLDLGQARKGDNRKTKQLLHWQPLQPQEAVIACAESLLAFGLVK